MSKSRGSGDPPCPFLGAPMFSSIMHVHYTIRKSGDLLFFLVILVAC